MPFPFPSSRQAPARLVFALLALLCIAIPRAGAGVIFNESGRTGSIPADWTSEGVYPTTAAGGYLRITNVVGWLATPPLDLTEYTDVLLSFWVAKFGSGTDGPLTVQVSTNGGATWDAQIFDSPIPTDNTYLTSGPTPITALSSNTVIRWTSANSPSEKRLRDILLSGTPVSPPDEEELAIRMQSFEGLSRDAWSWIAVPGDGRVSVSTDNRGQNGRYALKLTGSEDGLSNPYALFDNVDLAGYTSVTLSVAYASAGVDNNDDLYLELSHDNGETWPTSVQLMNGFGNFWLVFGDTDSDRTVAENPYTLIFDPAPAQMRVRIRFDEAAGAENRFGHYYIDDLRLTGEGDQPTLSFAEAEWVTERGAGTFSLPVSLSESADASVEVRFHGDAQLGTDFTVASTTLVFSAAGPSTLDLELEILDPPLSQGPRTAWFTLQQASGAIIEGPDQATLTIRDPNTFSIMAANLPSGLNLVNGFFPYDEAAKRIFRLLRPDIVAIQEWILLPGETLDSFVSDHFGETFDYFIEPDSNFPNGIISRWPIVAAGVWEDVEVFNRDFAWATIELPGARNLHAVSVHFKAGGSSSDRDSRIAQAQALTNYIAQAAFPATDYLVIAGDLNLAGRNEETLQILESIVSDALPPADQEGEQRTNIPRNQHYDFVLPSPLLESAHVPLDFGGFAFPNGIVFDSRLWDEHLFPVRVGDAADVNMQHLAVMKLFALEDFALPPEAFSAVVAHASAVELSWTPNAGGDDVVIVSNSDGVFGIPSGPPPAVGQPFAGGTVVHVGGGSPVLHESLPGCATVHYAIWSVDGADYSSRLTAEATLPEPAAPAGLFADTLSPTGMVVNWSGAPGVSLYRLDVSEHPAFATGGEGGPAGTNRFEEVGGGQASSYLTRTWTQDGIEWTAYKARTDLELDGLSTITLQNQTESYLVSDEIPGGIGTLTFLHQQQFSGSGGQLEVIVNDISQAIIDVTTSVQTAVVSGIDVSGPFTLIVSNNAAVRPALAELSWTSYEEPESLLVPGYDGLEVVGESVEVTGLSPETTYYFRLRSVVDPCFSEYSETGSATTLEDLFKDSDGDGIPDWWETLYFGGPTNAVATELAANEFNTLLEAYIADLNPLDPDAVLRLTGPHVTTPPYEFLLSTSSVARVYDLEWLADPLDPDWQPLGLDLPGTGGPLSLGVTNQITESFWRATIRLP